LTGAGKRRVYRISEAALGAYMRRYGWSRDDPR